MAQSARDGVGMRIMGASSAWGLGASMGWIMDSSTKPRNVAVADEAMRMHGGTHCTNGFPRSLLLHPTFFLFLNLIIPQRLHCQVMQGE